MRRDKPFNKCFFHLDYFHVPKDISLVQQKKTKHKIYASKLVFKLGKERKAWDKGYTCFRTSSQVRERKQSIKCNTYASKLVFNLGKENKVWNKRYTYFRTSFQVFQVRERKQSME